jgi:hypothetical protein
MAFNVLQDTEIDTHLKCDPFRLSTLIQKHRKAAKMIGDQKKMLCDLASKGANEETYFHLLQASSLDIMRLQKKLRLSDAHIAHLNGKIAAYENVLKIEK